MNVAGSSTSLGLTWSTGSLVACVPGAGTLEPGQRVGHYRLLEPLGYGAQAVVWRAVQSEPVVREVALKLLTGADLLCHRRVARLRREAERGMRLAARALLPAYEFGTADGIAFMAMPLVRGGTLQEIIDARRARAGGRHALCRLSRPAYLQAVLRILVGVARSLHAAHQAGVVHRDVKPSNILLDADDTGRGYLIDFGLARDLDVATLAQLRDGAGTPLYMAPEKLLGRQEDEVRCDLYALGATAYEAVTLCPPFEAPEGFSGLALLAYLAVHRPLRPRPARPPLNPALEAILLKAMDPAPERRQGTAAELADELETFLASSFPGPVASSRPPRPPRASAAAGDDLAHAGRRTGAPRLAGPAGSTTRTVVPASRPSRLRVSPPGHRA